MIDKTGEVMADIENLEEDKKKSKKSKEKQEKADNENVENEEEGGSKLVLVFVTFLIIVIWLGIIAILIKTDVGGFGSTVLTPILKDVPGINMILPNSDDVSTETEGVAYSSVEEAVEQIKELEIQLDTANAQIETDAKTIEELNAQIADLGTYKEEQANFELEKEKYYEEVVFSDKAPDIEEYKTYYESIDPENAEVLYKQVCEQIQKDQEIKDYAATYSSMKPKEAAAIFDTMTDDLNLVADILQAMDSESRAKIMGKMNADNAAKLTEIMNPQ